MPEDNTLTRCEELYSKAKSGEKIDTENRRDVIAFLMATEPGMTNSDMARVFGLSEGMIRKDKEIVRKKMAEEISGEDVGLVIGDIRRTYERFQSSIEKGLKKCQPGTKNELDYLKASVDYQLKMVDALQSLGYYPKNLGTMQQNKFVFKSTVAKDGSVETRAVDPSKPIKTIEGKVPLNLVKESDEESDLREALRDEYCETPRDPGIGFEEGEVLEP